MQPTSDKYSCHSIGGGGLGSSGYSSSGTNLNLNNTINNNNNNNAYASYVTGSKNNQVIYHGSSETNENCKYDNTNTSFMHNDELVNEIISRSGPSNIYQRKDYSHEIGALAQQKSAGCNVTSSFQEESNAKSSAHNSSIYNNSYEENFGNASIIKIEPPPQLNSSSIINQDPEPYRIVKPNTQNIVYKQEVKIKYLQPPTPPPPAPIIIYQKILELATGKG